MSIRAVLIALLTVCSISVPAQQPAGGGGGDGGKVLMLKDIVGGAVLTPEYQVKRNPQNARVKNWYQVVADYETKPEWLDEVEFTYFVLVENPKATRGPKQNLFKGSVTYINVNEGKHRSDMFLHPNTVARFGEVKAVAVVVSVQGRIVAMESKPRSNQRWWEQLAPVEGLLLSRDKTPFAPLYFDDYEPVKQAAK